MTNAAARDILVNYYMVLYLHGSNYMTDKTVSNRTLTDKNEEEQSSLTFTKDRHRHKNINVVNAQKLLTPGTRSSNIVLGQA